MNCCDAFGNCRQGRDCPTRAPVSLPGVPAAAVVARVRPLRSCDELGVCLSPMGECRANCRLHDPLSPLATGAQREASTDILPLGLVRMLCWLLLALVLGLLLISAGALAGYGWVRWGQALSTRLWQLFASLA